MARQRHHDAHAARADASVSDLPVAALSHPKDTLERAERILGSAVDPERRSYAGQARGIALRELGNVRAAVRQLEAALADAAEAGVAREADVSASLGVTLAVAGRSGDALALLDSALSKVSGLDAARIRVRQGSLLGELGHFDDAAHALRTAARTLRRAGDAIWESRALLNLAMVSIEIGATRRADIALSRAEELLVDNAQAFEAATARQYRGLVAVLEGRIPDALAHYDVARQRFAAAGTQTWELAESRAAALLSAGLAIDALASAQEAVALLRGPGAAAGYRARALVRAGEAASAAGRPQLARTYDQQALRLFRKQGRDARAVLARLGIVRARYDMGEQSRRLLRDMIEVAEDARRRKLTLAVDASLLAGELALDLDDVDAASVHLDRAQRARTSRSDLAKVLGWRAAALRAHSAGRRGSVFRACDRGLAVLETHQLTLGAIETRAAATTHGRPLASIALAEAFSSGDPLLILRWTERWRATTFSLPPVRTDDDPELSADLARLRLARRHLDEATHDGQPAAALERDVATLEASVRGRTLRSGGDASSAGPRIDVTDVVDELGDVHLVEICPEDDVLHVVVASGSGVRHHVAGSYLEALRRTDLARFTLRRMTHRTAGVRARATLPVLSASLEQTLLGSAAADLGTGPVVIVPPAALSSAPWGILPALREREVSVAPSAVSWLTARRARPARHRRVALIAGPGLRQAGAEIEKTGQLYPRARMLGVDGRPATTSAVLAAIDGAWIAHIAAHGTFRNDNPMFSALTLDDGPLTVFDLQRLRRAPHRLVLSCCDTGAVSAAGADEMLGLLSALVPLGTAGMLAAVVPVSDEAAVGFASIVHDRLRSGRTTAYALRDARAAAADDPAAFAIAHAFVAFGAV